MNRLSELIERYEHFKSSSFDKLTLNEDGESIEALCETDWVRVLLIRTADEPDSINIEVEVSLPENTSEQGSKIIF